MEKEMKLTVTIVSKDPGYIYACMETLARELPRDTKSWVTITYGEVVP